MTAGTENAESAQSADIIQTLTQQHREVEALFGELEGCFGTKAQEAEDAARKAVTLLVEHSVAEEVHLYPLVRRTLDDGDALADREIAEHDEAERTMKRLESLPASSGDFWLTFRILTNLIRQHVGEEEKTLFPLLARACDAGELRELGQKVRSTERFAPTRPHPQAPSEGAALSALGPAAGLVDRIRDALSGRGR